MGLERKKKMEMVKMMMKLVKMTVKMMEKNLMMEVVVGVVGTVEGEKIEWWWEVAEAVVRR